MMAPPVEGLLEFPDTFQDFFAKLEEDETVTSLLEDKLIPREAGGTERRRWAVTTRRSFNHRSKPDHAGNSASASPGVRRPRPRSSSIAVARQPPDLHRFLQAETSRPWGHHHLSPAAAASPTPSPAASPTPRCHPQPHPQQRQRCRTASMPVAVPSATRHKPMLGQIRRWGEVEGEEGVYRVRSFSITATGGVANLGDSFRSRRSRSSSSVSSSCSSVSAGACSRDRGDSNASRASSITSAGGCYDADAATPAHFKVGMLGAGGVGKTTLTYQFTTSEYICAYDTSLDEEFGQKTVTVLLDGQEAELEIIDIPSSEMSVETFCSTYSPDVFVVVYSVVDRKSLTAAESILLFLWKNDCIERKGVILVGNKADLQRNRQVPTAVGRKTAHSCGCKFIETSSGLDHNVDELLVGVLAQVKLNPQRGRGGRKKRLQHRGGGGRRLIKSLLMGMRRQAKSCENLLVL